MSEWIIPCNPSKYDVVGAFGELDQIDWKQSVNCSIGDTVYIYVASPVQAIRFRCIVTKVDMVTTGIDDSKYVIDDSDYADTGRYMRLKIEDKTDSRHLGFDDLKKNGLKTVQGPSGLSGKLSAYISSMFDGGDDADDEIESLLESSNDAVISGYIAQFEKELPEFKKKEKELEKLREKFVQDYYSFKSIENMTKEEYVIGLQREDSFCYRLENELVGLGNIHGAPSLKFGLYFGELGDDSDKKYRTNTKFNDDPDIALEEIKREIVMLRINGEKKDFEKIIECKLAPLFRGKILSTYFPEEYLPIFSKEHLDYFLGKLGLVILKNEDILYKQERLLEWKKSVKELAGFSNYLFMRFLYFSFNRPKDDADEQKRIQEQKDRSYPKKYVTKVKITIDQWENLIKNPEIFHEDDLDLLKRFYLSDNHAASCYDLGLQDGVNPTSYIQPVVALAKRISDEMGLKPILRDDGSRVWWRILFWGRYREDTHFEWKLQPKLAKAMKRVYPELEEEELNDDEDNKLVEELKPASLASAEPDFQYSGKPKKKAAPVFSNGHKTYPRDRQIAINALAHAHYLCEIDPNHPTFVRRSSDKTYTEPHHLVPMSASDSFSVSLDTEENIVSLCSNCHNQIHYGRDAASLIKRLFKDRKDALKSVNIDISEEELLKLYHING